MSTPLNADPAANALIKSSSPYLLQHAYNPVDWYPWGKEALSKAITEDKPILVSIGYSACHWCHVMEKESFENDSIAAVMNKYFVCIKVDREERPDVDQIYMDAVQAMGQNGGWPLNVFLTAEQKPFYGGTYFPPEAWRRLLLQIAEVYEQKRDDVESSAQQLTEAIATSEVIKYGLVDKDHQYSVGVLDNLYEKMAQHFDTVRGGFNRAPKFPMPGQWSLLLRYYQITKNPEALRQVELTLKEIALGGINDQVGGGFARYSVDKDWLVPHFEKMLYDNGQLLSLYSEAYSATHTQLFKEIVYQTIAWLETEMMSEEGGFYAALDADSEGEEGKYYVWSSAELDSLIPEYKELVSKYYNITEEGNWEHGKNILHRRITDAHFAKENNLEEVELQSIISRTNKILLDARNKRIRPGLDDKILSGWNGLALKGLTDAYKAFGEAKFLSLALTNAEFIKTKLVDTNFRLYRNYKGGKADINGYLEDYAFVVDAYISLYEVTFDEQWLSLAQSLTAYCLQHFYDDHEKLFFYTDDSSEALIARKKEIFDNVIPASNAQMAFNLYQLGIIYDNKQYTGISRDMMAKVVSMLESESAYLYQWAKLYIYQNTPTAEIAIIGPEARVLMQSLQKHYSPNRIIMGATKASDLPLLKDKQMLSEKTTIYVCYNKTCKLPVHTAEEAITQLE